MAEAVQTITAYDVSVDESSLTVWNLGDDGTGCAVQLSGSIDDWWARCYYLLRLESDSFSRFHLDKEKKIVWFACRAGDGLGKLQPVLKHLVRLVEAVNQSAESEP